MSKTKSAFINLACILFSLSIPLYMVIPPFGAQPFHDELGNWLVIGIWGSFGLAMIIPMIGLYSNKHIPDRLGVITLCAFAGLGLILLGYWAYGEKDRFAALPVTQVEAQVTKLNVGLS